MMPPGVGPNLAAPASWNKPEGFREEVPQFGSTFSPLGGSYSTPMGAAIHRVKETTHPMLEYEEFNFKDWAITQKGISKSHAPFDGHPEQYPTWWSRVKDHLMIS